MPEDEPLQAHWLQASAKQSRSTAPPSDQGAWRKRWWITTITLFALVGVLASCGSQDENGTPDPPQEVAATLPENRAPDERSIPDSTAAPSATDAVADSGDGSLAFDSLVPVDFGSYGDPDGAVWNVRLSKPRDVTAAVLATREYNDPPPDGVVFAGFDVEMTLASSANAPRLPGLNFFWEFHGGATAEAYEYSTIDGLLGCGRLAGEFDELSEVFVGGTLTGTVCIPLPTADLSTPGTQVAMNFAGERVMFSSSGSSPAPAQIANSGGVTSAGPELALGVSVPVEFQSSRDADGSVWNVVVSPLRDMTTEVADADESNYEPPEGVQFVGFHLEMTLASAPKVPLSTIYNVRWEILGGATARVHDGRTIPGLDGCGVINNRFSANAEVFLGGTVTGNVCMPLPAEDLVHPDTRIAFSFDEARILFSPDGPAPEAAAIGNDGGPSSISDPHPIGIAIPVEYSSSFDEADGSIWATTVHNLRDMTADVVDASPSNHPPPEGVAWVGFDVEMTLLEGQEEPLSPGFELDWEIFGGESRRVYLQNTLPGLINCGVPDNEFNPHEDLLIGETVSGTVCIPLPLTDLDHPDTLISMNFNSIRTIFQPN